MAAMAKRGWTTDFTSENIAKLLPEVYATKAYIMENGSEEDFSEIAADALNSITFLSTRVD